MSNKNDANKQAVLEALGHVRSALQGAPPSEPVARALDQCGRLELALTQFHAEGLRFAAFTLIRLVQSGSTAFPEGVHVATQRLKSTLEAAGFPH